MAIQANAGVPLDNKQLRIYDHHGKYTRVSVDEAIARGYNKFRGWICSAGVRGLYIDYDGNIWVGNCASSNVSSFNQDGWDKITTLFHLENGEDSQEKFEASKATMLKEYYMSGKGYGRKLSLEDGKKNYWGYVGNVEEGMILPDDYTRCKFESCGCGADVILSKARLPEHIPLLDVTTSGVLGTGRSVNYQESIQEHEVAGIEMNFPIPYQVLWDISRRCNYDCTYCWPGVHNNKETFLPYESIIETMQKIISEWALYDEVRWNFGGGEPTMHPQFIDILKFLKEQNQWVLVTTNGARSTKFWKEAAKYINTVNMSAHFDSMDQFPGNEDRFIENCKVIMDHHDEVDADLWIEIKLMTPPGFLERAMKFKKRIEDLGLYDIPGKNGRQKGSMSLVPIREIGDSGKLAVYSEEELEFFKHQ